MITASRQTGTQRPYESRGMMSTYDDADDDDNQDICGDDDDNDDDDDDGDDSHLSTSDLIKLSSLFCYSWGENDSSSSYFDFFEIKFNPIIDS